MVKGYICINPLHCWKLVKLGRFMFRNLASVWKIPLHNKNRYSPNQTPRLINYNWIWEIIWILTLEVRKWCEQKYWPLTLIIISCNNKLISSDVILNTFLQILTTGYSIVNLSKSILFARTISTVLMRWKVSNLRE
jgi:hypothetical protein